jgi:hypothetical protein
MKRTASISPLEKMVTSSRGFRHEETSQDNELASILGQIHAKYSGSLLTFFEALEKGEGASPNAQRPQKYRVASKK